MKNIVFLLFFLISIQLNADSSQKIYTYKTLQTEIENSKLPIILYFTAKWCLSCKNMENTTFKNPMIQDELKNFKFITIDVTQNNKYDQEILEHFHVFGPPSIVFFNSKEKKLNGFIDTKTLLLNLQNSQNKKKVLDQDTHKVKQKQKLTETIQKLKDLANQNNVNAQFLLGTYYYKTHPMESVQWLKKAEENKCPAAMGILGLQLFENNKQNIGFSKILKAANNGDITSEIFIAQCYQKGSYVKQDYIKAYSWLFQAGKYNSLVSINLFELEQRMSKLEVEQAKQMALKRIEILGEIPKEACYSNINKNDTPL